MPNWHANIHKNILAIRMVDDPRKHLPRMQKDITFQKVVETAISRNFELRTDSQGGSSSFGNFHAFDDTCCVTLEIEGPLV